MKVAWNKDEEAQNLKTYGISFKLAKEVIMNSSSLKVSNLERDFVFIGPTDDLGKVLVVNCKLEDGFRKIRWARRASPKEEDGYFNFLAEGGTK